MSAKDKIVVLGGGPNGLTAAVLLAKKGWEVTVLEAREAMGGLAQAEEFHPGYFVPGIHLDSTLVRPWVLEALGILFARRPRSELVLPFANGQEIRLRPDAEESALLGDVPPGDREAWPHYRAFLTKVKPILERVMDRPPPGTLDSLASHVGTAWSVRRLGSETMNELLRVLPMSVADWLRDFPFSDRLCAGMCLPALAASYTGPLSPHSALRLLLHECLSMGEIVGGPAAVVRRLEAAAKSVGVELRTGAIATKILTGRDGVTGIRLATGEELPTRSVLSTLDPKQTFHDLIGPPWLPLVLDDTARVYRMRGITAVMRLALSGPLETRAGTKVEALRTGETLFDIERAWDAARYRRLAEVPVLDVRVPSVADPSLCPAGHAVVSMHVHTAPYDLLGGFGPDVRASFKEAAISALSAVCPSLRERLISAQLLTPTDLATRYRLSGGHLFHGEEAPDQFLSFRPSLVAGRYATPIPGLFLGGGGSHPGGGFHLGSGALAAQAIVPPSTRGK